MSRYASLDTPLGPYSAPAVLLRPSRLLRGLAIGLLGPMLAGCQPAATSGPAAADGKIERRQTQDSPLGKTPTDGTPAATATDFATGTATRVRVTPIRAKRKTLVRYCEQPGRVLAWEQSPIWAKVSGYVRAVHVDIGDLVLGPKSGSPKLALSNAGTKLDAKPPVTSDKQTTVDQAAVSGAVATRGQLLIELDVPELRDELAQREAAVELEAALVKRDEAAIRVANAARDTAAARESEARAAQSRATADQERWRAEYDRISMLAARMAISDKVLDETRSKLAAAQAAFEESEARIRSAAAAAAEAAALVVKAEADRDAGAARWKAVAAERDRARTMVGYAELRAPFDGVVAARHVDVGHLVGAGVGAGNNTSGLSAGGAGSAGAKAPLLEIVALDPVRVVVDVPESDAVMVEKGAAASVRIDALGPTPFAGQVARATWSLSQATRTMRVEIDVPNPQRRLRPGMFAHAKITAAERPDALVLPKSAILGGPGKPACWVIGANSQLVRRELRLGLEAAGEFEVIEGLAPDDDVVGQNVAAFREGQLVDRASPKL
jgi:HlyD family secretion protein